MENITFNFTMHDEEKRVLKRENKTWSNFKKKREKLKRNVQICELLTPRWKISRMDIFFIFDVI